MQGQQPTIGGTHASSAHRVDRLVLCGPATSAGAQVAPPGAGARPSRSKIYKLEELTWPQIDALDRERTLFILPVGMVEQHGPHLPVGADTLGVTYEANGASTRVSRALPDWNVVMMPPINYGQGGANQLGDMLVHPGTYGIRQSTLRSLVADIGGQIAQNGFKWIFVMNGHGAPTHNIAINEACDFVSETFRRDDAAPHGSVPGRCGDSIERRADQRQVLFGRGALLLRHGCSCRRRRNIGHARYPTRSGSFQLQDAPEPSGALAGGVARNRDRTRLAGLSLVSCEGDGGVRPSGRGMVDRRVHGPDSPRRARGEHVRPCRVCPRRCLRRVLRFSRRHSRTKPHSKRSSRTGWRNAGSVDAAIVHVSRSRA